MKNSLQSLFVATIIVAAAGLIGCQGFCHTLFFVCKIKYSFNKLLMIAMKKRANDMIKRKKHHFSLANPMVGPIFVLRKRFAGHLANWLYAYII